ncbi:hypothetical protein SAMN05421823_103695 [Catalinimonas alkaloidigena]|uniref:DNA binding domain-containing protein, excisionase family n=1 Tax=Catalinimonas alkaloidigena TaxID=1075417 RepID=A0A1G9F7N8_9BACT|nr:hypothetical protein [Catalinimonas alkaloidigena]SDK84345.1 hypothetical protein SAMN05421823_103695 [Catalinimonas alkaloidigena]
MAKLNVTQAAKAAGISRTTFYKDIDKKRISFDVDERGNKLFDTSELLRHYPDLKAVDTPKTVQVNKVEQPEHSVDYMEYLMLKKENEMLRRERDIERERREAAEFREESHLRIIEKQTYLLEGSKRDQYPAMPQQPVQELPEPETVTPQAAPKAGGFFGWLLGN